MCHNAVYETAENNAFFCIAMPLMPMLLMAEHKHVSEDELDTFLKTAQQIF